MPTTRRRALPVSGYSGTSNTFCAGRRAGKSATSTEAPRAAQHMNLSIFEFGSAGKALLFTADPIVVTKNGFGHISSVRRDGVRELG